MKSIITQTLCLLFISLLASPLALAQETAPADDESNDQTNEEAAESTEPKSPRFELNAGPSRDGLINQTVTFDVDTSTLSLDAIAEVLWEFGDGISTTGSNVSHQYTTSGTYQVKLRLTTDNAVYEDTTEVRIFEHLAILVTDPSVPTEQIELHQRRAAKEDILLLSLQAKSSGPEVLIEEELTQQLLDIRPTVRSAHLVIVWSSGSVGANIITKFAQHVRQTDDATTDSLDLASKGIILLSETPFAVLKPAAQSAFDQLRPNYVLLARPQVLDLVLTATTADEAKNSILASPLDYRLLGTFSARTASDLSLTNIMSFGINFLINRGVPVSSIALILMLPVIATIIAFARQVIGIKAFGLVTPALTTLSFLVMGLRYGLIVFVAVLLAGTLTRSALRRLRLLYLPRMALVLTSISLSLLVVLALGVVGDRNTTLSFSIFPALILTILAEEIIAAQFKLGLRTALTLTAWTLFLAMLGYFLMSSELFRTLILSYPEIVLLAIPINIALGQWGGLRLTEYIRFRQLLRQHAPTK